MNINEKMTWQDFKEGLSQHKELSLQFRYEEDKWISPSYHITEVKRATIDSVDCGGRSDKWDEVIVQVWIPETERQEFAMKAQKALSIINLVETKLSLDPESIVKIEYGYSDFDTRQMLPKGFESNGTDLIVNLTADITQCKAKEKCGIQEPVNSEPSACCAPASGCC